ncbi:hypothetical protein [Asaia sp. VD9]|uniref:hypothetical protein n=1 Tax=Asaia sp. VD9 TaxID=3081235 RepID=UPI00301A11B6
MSDTSSNTSQTIQPAPQYAIVNASNVVVNRIIWDGQGDIWLFEGERYVLDESSAYPIGSTYTGATEPSVAPHYYGAAPE